MNTRSNTQLLYYVIKVWDDYLLVSTLFMPFKEGQHPTGDYKEFLEVDGKHFEVRRPEILNISDIVPGDRIFVSTRTGNRYMIRWSQSANAPKIYSERENFDIGYVMANTYHNNPMVTEKGKPLSSLI